MNFCGVSTVTAKDSDAVLIVGNNKTNLKHLANQLQANSYKVFTTHCGENVLRQAKDNQPDAVLLDIVLPALNGIELCRRLKADHYTADIPVLLVIAGTEIDDWVKNVFEVGADDYVTKPIHIEELLARLKTHLTLRKLRRRRSESARARPEKDIYPPQTGTALTQVDGELANWIQARILELEEANVNLTREIIERKRMEGELRHHRDHLEELAAARTVTLERANQQLARQILERRRIEAELREREQFIESIANAVPNVWYVYDVLDNRSLFINQAVNQVLGYTVEEAQALGANLFAKLIHPDDLATLPDIRARLETLTPGKFFDAMYRLRHRNGDWRWVLARYAAFRQTLDEEVSKILLVMQDITVQKEAQDALAESETRYRLVTELISDFAYAHYQFPDAHYEPVWVTDAFEQIFGLSYSEFDARGGFLALAHPDDRGMILQAVQKMLAEGHSYDFEFRIIRPNGEVRWLRDSGGPIDWAGPGQPVLVCGATRDITARKRAEEALQKAHGELEQRVNELITLNRIAQTLATATNLQIALDIVVKKLTELLNAYSTSITILDESRSHLELLAHFEQDDKFDQNIGLVFRLDDYPVARKIIEHGQYVIVPCGQTNTPAHPAHYLIRNKDIYCLMSIPVQIRGKTIGILSVSTTDVGHVFSPVELGLAETIAGQVAGTVQSARLFAEEQRQRQIAESRNKELDAFARTVAHDLRNPLGLVISYADYLTEYGSETGVTDILEIVAKIKQSGQRTLNIIDELLVLTGVHKRQVKTVPVDMAPVVARAQEWLAPLIQTYQPEIILPKKWPVVEGYAPWLEQVWTNYLSNGLKYGGRPPRLELGATPQDNGTIRFWVRDNGPGLTVEAQAALFTEFTRLSEVKVKGYGLGLSIVRRIMEKLGGRVGVESQVGYGSEFYFELPSADDD